MKLQSKFIEGTNKQYSIRNDGVVISHYLKTRGINSYRDKVLTVHNYNNCFIYIKNEKKTVSPQVLLYEYFGFRKCNHCNVKIYNLSSKVCVSCIQSKIRSTDNKRYHNNIEHFRIKAKLLYNKRFDLISPTFVASSLRMKTIDIDETIYQAVKTRIQIKRKVKQLIKENG